MLPSLVANAQSPVVYLNCSFVRTSSGSNFPTTTVQDTSVIRIDLSTGLASGGGAASIVSDASEFQSKITDMEIVGRARGSIAWIGSGTEMTRGVFSINRVSGKYAGNYRLEFSQGGYREDFEEGACKVGKPAF